MAPGCFSASRQALAGADVLVDPRVAKAKYARELERLRAQAPLLSSRGVFVVADVYPNVDVLFVPLRPPHFAIDVGQAASSLIIQAPMKVPRGATLRAEGRLDMLAPRPFIGRFGLDNFDLFPPSLRFLDPATKAPLQAQQLVIGHLMAEDGRTLQRVLLDGHPVHQRPFLCLRGIREYHDHPQHSGDDWLLYRKSMGLFHAVDLVWRTVVAPMQLRLIASAGRVDLLWEMEKKP